VARLTDFGDEDFREPLRRVLRSYAGEAPLSPTGRAFKRGHLIDMLATRLRVRREVSDRPELAEGTPRRPLVVTGLPRTGTTLLQRLLSLDPDARPLLAWEAMWPARLSRKDEGSDRRKRYTRRLTWLARRILPGIDRIHPLDPDGPEECTRLLDSSFRWGYLATERRMPEYAAWLASLGPAGMEAAYRWYALQLRVLEGQRPTPGHWVLKSPAHLGILGPLFAVMPDARVVVTVRDPRTTVASACSLFALLYSATAANPRTGKMGQAIAATLARTLARGLEVAAMDPARVRVVRYDDLVARPVETLEGIHAGFGLPFPPELAAAARDWLARNPQGVHGVHRYDLATYGLDEGQVLEVFAETEETLGRIRS
jgi:hypothetical protein